MALITRHLGAELFQRVLHRQRVHHRGQHAHVVAGDPVHAAGGQAGAAEDVAAADHQADLHAGARTSMISRAPGG
jgi:preprotein translocase subunit YajC